MTDPRNRKSLNPLPVRPPPGCRTEWDEIRCWLRAEVGQVVNVSCAEVSQLFNNEGYIFRNCTKDGWTDLYPTYEEACEFGEDVATESEVGVERGGGAYWKIWPCHT
ncbi:hypothetical protein SKAU_G00076060 [Synaphobranchus kaupii]|uniref:G-protein coupled receptors family 2 profile 1 domain-containing protein n=1 Tax=Synaphobranchus kaupii TaxID=118154 RepID=A0A9Q1JB00_SYNKA|nr:hypothetical protein SKAU_G00076060 [Synaphobranchus kaupii]